MKLADLDIIVTAPPAPGWGGRYWILVKITTDTGVTGWGECYASTVGPDAMRAVITDVFSRHMAGENPENIDLMFRRVYSAGFTQRPDLTVMGAWSGLEIACWDILGKDRDRPVHALIGGRTNDRIRAYTYLYPQAHHALPAFWGNADLAAESAIVLVDQGYTAVKFDPAGPYTIRGGHMPSRHDIATSVAFCKAIRDAVGDRADLLFGTHGQFSTAGAIRMGQAIAHYDPLWYEEPIPPDNTHEMSKVAAKTGIPIATGERLFTKWGFREVLEQGAAFDLLFSDMVMPGDMDGLSLAKTIRARHPDLPVVLTTGYSEAAATATAERFKLLSKPYGIDALEAALSETLVEARGATAGV